jgi:glycosyltransferase involved in cell wall biosynthesis
MKSRRPAIVTVATVAPGKGLLEMLAVLESLADLDWSWEIIGDLELDREFAQEFCSRASRSSVRGRISIRGAAPPAEVLAAYDRSDLFALPSCFETCSMATMEAMARGLPVAAFRVGGLPGLLPATSRRHLTEPGDQAGWIEALRQLLGDPDHRQRLARANRKASRRFLSWEESGDELERFLRRL